MRWRSRQTCSMAWPNSRGKLDGIVSAAEPARAARPEQHETARRGCAGIAERRAQHGGARAARHPGGALAPASRRRTPRAGSASRAADPVRRAPSPRRAPAVTSSGAPRPGRNTQAARAWRPRASRAASACARSRPRATRRGPGWRAGRGRGARSSPERVENLGDDLEAAEGRHQIGAGIAGRAPPRGGPGPSRSPTRSPRSPASRMPRPDGVRDRDARHLVVQELGVAGRMQRQDADHHGNRRRGPSREERARAPRGRRPAGSAPTRAPASTLARKRSISRAGLGRAGVERDARRRRPWARRSSCPWRRALGSCPARMRMRPIASTSKTAVALT